MDRFLRVDSGTGTNSSGSFNTDNADATSICPLITPSPPTNALVDPIPEPLEPNYQIGEQLAEKLQKVQAGDAESISSASSSEQPITSQLLDKSNFLNMPPEEELTTEAGKTTLLELTFRNPTDDYFFMSWNWPLIRKFSLYTYLSALIAMLALVVGLIATLPKTCNPPTQWYQGNLFYEIFPASFYSSNHGMEGDLKGIAMKADYLKNLGVRGVRLNSIFSSPHYPKDYEHPISLMEIDSVLGTLDDFKYLAAQMRLRNISVILDLPVTPFIQKSFLSKSPISTNGQKNQSDPDFFSISNSFEPIEEAMQFWRVHGVEGFYLKGLEKNASNYGTARLLRRWKKLLGSNVVLIVHQDVINFTPKENINIVLNNIDLVDIKLNIDKGVLDIISQIDAVGNGTLFTKPGMPWVHWSIGNVNSNRLANILPYGNATLGATLLQMMLPGTPSIFYGDEIGLHQIADPEGDRKDIQHLHQLTMMPWKNEVTRVIPWIYGGDPQVHYEQKNAVIKMAQLRKQSPSIYMNAVYKEGVTKANAEVKYSEGDFLVIQRWYPRRKSYVVASNLGSVKISNDLSSLLYTGQVRVGPKVDSTAESISFKEVNLWPGESVVIELD